MQPSYPSSQNLSDFLSEAGFNTGNFSLVGVNVAQAIAAGIARFERETGRHFLGTSAARTFDPPLQVNSILDLKQDLISPSAVSLSGTALVSGTDYRFLPQDAPQESKPYNRIQLLRSWFLPITQPIWGALSITGTWAYGATIPDDAWLAMITAGAIDRLPLIITLANGGMIEMKEADIVETYGQKPFIYLREAWMSTYEAAVSNYKRVTVGW